jgi:hypothetical protein
VANTDARFGNSYRMHACAQHDAAGIAMHRRAPTMRAAVGTIPASR